jgi:dipeptidyl aminopeptidase/acylaminoacyl peptidase
MADGEAFDYSRTLNLLPRRLLRRLSPIRRIDPSMPPVLLFHGTADRTVHVDQSVRYYEALQKAGGRGELEIYEGGDHAFLNLPDEVWFSQETRALEFFERCFAPAIHRTRE